jgi:cytochrome c-type biogenesis protein CcmH
LALGRLSTEEAAQQQSDLLSEVSQEFGNRDFVRRSPVSRKTALCIALLGTSLATFIYMSVGMPHLAENVPAQVVQNETQDPLKLIIDLEAKVAKDPKDAASWETLAAAYKYSAQHAKSVAAFEKFFALVPATEKASARALAEFAEVLALNSESNFAGRPTALLAQALGLDPNEPKSLAMMGAAQFRAGNLADAKKYLGQLMAQMPPNSPQVEQLKPLIARIDEQLANNSSTKAAAGPAANTTPSAPTTAPATTGTPTPTLATDSKPLSQTQKTDAESKPEAKTGPSAAEPPTEKQTDSIRASLAKAILGGTISLSPNAKSANALQGVKAIFLSVKMAAPTSTGPSGQVESVATRSMPVAALKIDDKLSETQWPIRFTLSDDQSLRPQAPLSRAGEVMLEVHLSRTGLPGKNTGDWFGRVGPVKAGSAALDIKVDQQLP